MRTQPQVRLSSFVCRARNCSFSSSRSLASALRLMEHLGIALHLLLDQLKRHLQILAERRIAEGLVDLLAHLHLLLGEGLHGMLEIARHHHLHLVAVKRDQLTQEGDGQQRVAGL